MTGANARKQQFLEFANRQAAAHNTGANRKHKGKEHLVSIELCDDTKGKEAFLQWGELPNQGQLCWKLYRHPPRLQGFARAGCCLFINNFRMTGVSETALMRLWQEWAKCGIIFSPPTKLSRASSKLLLDASVFVCVDGWMNGGWL